MSRTQPPGGADATVAMTRRRSPASSGRRPRPASGGRSSAATAAVAVLKAWTDRAQGLAAERAGVAPSPVTQRSTLTPALGFPHAAGSRRVRAGRRTQVVRPGAYSSSSRDHAHLRAPPRPLRVLAARRRVQDRRAGRPRGGVRPARARPHRPRRHERRGRALQGLPQARRQAAPGARGLLRRRPHGARAEASSATTSRCSPRRRGLPQPRQALQRRASSRACTAASPGVDLELLARHGDGVICLVGLPGLARAAGASSRAGPQEARAHLDDLVQVFGPENVYFEVQRNGIAEQEQVNEAIAALRARDGPAARRDRRRALPPPRGLPPPRRAAVRADEVDARAAEDVLRHQRVLPEELGGDGGRRSPTCRRRSPPRWRSPSAATSRSSSASQLIPRFETPDGEPERDYLRALVDGGPAHALRRPAARRRRRARRHGARGHRPHGLLGLLPDRLGLRRLRQVATASRSGRAAARRPARSSPTACRSPTSTRSATTCSSSASSTPSACRCPTSTSTSPCAAASA